MPPLYTIEVSGPNGAGRIPSAFGPPRRWADAVREFNKSLCDLAPYDDARWPLTYYVVQVSA